MTKIFLYKRPEHMPTKMVKRQDGILVDAGVTYTSALIGLDAAVRGTSMGGGILVDSLRILRKIDAAVHQHEVKLHFKYTEFTEIEKEIITVAGINFDWSKYSIDSGNTSWIHWIEFLEGFDKESDTYRNTWIEYDPLHPDAGYAEWKENYKVLENEWNEKVEAARRAALSAKQ